jgi:methylenetetrahydrofolate dehydrogenase (NADP+)/methenyltetrahydrofolate cyclohydrolase
MILYGAPVRNKIKEELISRIEGLGRTPSLTIIQVGDREESNLYIKNKILFGTEIGVKVLRLNLKEETELEDGIKRLNEDKETDGIIIQLPLPEKFNTKKILSLINRKKDADGLISGSAVIPATARAVLALLEYYKIEVRDKKTAVVGQGILAGRPISEELERRGALVQRSDIKTPEIFRITRECDILVSAVGKPYLITKDFVKPGAAVIDVGISKLDGKTVGDVKLDEVSQIAGSVSPVPGGVGPVTVACLFWNVIDLCYNGTVVKNINS